MPLSLHPSVADRPLAEVIRDAGIVGAGGAGFPTYAKYERPQPTLLINAQESEPGYFIDKWLHDTRAADFLDLWAHLQAWGVQRCVVGAKQKDRASFARMEGLAGVEQGRARVLDCTGRNRHDLSAQPEPMLFAYTDDRYPYGMETALLLIVAQQKIPQGQRPNEHGFIVSNSETLMQIHQALTTGRPVTHKYVHVYGATPRHTFREVPVGTSAADVLADAGLTVDEIMARGLVVADGGPGWFEAVDPQTAVVRRRTNSLIVLDPTVVDVTKKDVLPGPNKPGYPLPDTTFTRSPSSLSVSMVTVPLIDNPKFNAVRAAIPTVQVGDVVALGQRIAEASDEGVSVPCHASLAGVVEAIDGQGIRIRATP